MSDFFKFESLNPDNIILNNNDSDYGISIDGNKSGIKLSTFQQPIDINIKSDFIGGDVQEIISVRNFTQIEQIFGQSINTIDDNGPIGNQDKIVIYETGSLYGDFFSRGPYIRLGKHNIISEKNGSKLGIGTLFPEEKVHISGGNLKVEDNILSKGNISGRNILYKYNNQTVYGVNTFENQTVFGKKIFNLEQKIDNTGNSDQFGRSVAANKNGDIIVVGVPFNDPNAVSNAGAAFIYAKNNNEWSLKQIISGDTNSDQFGSSVAINNDGNVILIGGPLDDPNGLSNAGAALVYTGNSIDGWSFKQILSGDSQSDYFGWSVATNSDGTVLMMGGYEDDDGGQTAGGVIVYVGDTINGWNFKQKLIGDSSDDQFGYSVDSNNDASIIVMGGILDNDIGGAMIFVGNKNDGWSLKQKINGDLINDYYGRSVAISDDGKIIVMGGPFSDPYGITHAGTAIIFVGDDIHGWAEKQRISGELTNDNYGWSVDTNDDGSIIIVGGPGDDIAGNGNGGAIIYQGNSDNGWNLKYKIYDNLNINTTAQLGYSVAINKNGDTLLAGAPSNDPSGYTNAGSVYVYKVTDISLNIDPTYSESNNILISGNSKYVGNIDFTNRPTVNGTGVLLSGEIPELPNTIVYTTGDQTISGVKNFVDNVYIKNLFVTGTETIVNTTNFNVQSPYLILNLTGGVNDGGIFFVTGSGLTGVNDYGPIIGFDHSNKFKFGVARRSDDLSTLNDIAAVQDITNYSGFVDSNYYGINNPSGYITGVNLSAYITTDQTGAFYPNSNPNGFITNQNVVYTTGDQIINGNKDFYGDEVIFSGTNVIFIENTGTVYGAWQFSNRPTVNGTGVLLSGEATAGTVENVVYTTGDQTISGIKIFATGIDIFNATSPQRLRIFNSTGINSGEFAVFGWQQTGTTGTPNALVIGTQATQSGILRDVILNGRNIRIPTGDLYVGTTGAGTSRIYLANPAGAGLYHITPAQFNMSLGPVGGSTLTIDSNYISTNTNFRIQNVGYLFGEGTQSIGLRDAYGSNNTVGTNNQGFNIYKIYSGSDNNFATREFLTLGWTGTTGIIGTRIGTSGTLRDLIITGNNINIASSGNVQFNNRPTVNGTGILLSGEAYPNSNPSGFITNTSIQKFITGMETGIDSYTGTFATTFSTLPVIAATMETTGVYGYVVNLTRTTTSGFVVDFSDVIRESGVELNIIAYG